MVNRCSAKNASGNPCSAYVRPGDQWCRWHHPDREAERKQWRVRGGKNKSTSARLRRLWAEERLEPAEVTGLLSAALIATYQGELEPGVLSAIASGAKALLTAHDALDIASRLEALELASQQRKGFTA